MKYVFNSSTDLGWEFPVREKKEIFKQNKSKKHKKSDRISNDIMALSWKQEFYFHE
jgi:hypothetical protein